LVLEINLFESCVVRFTISIRPLSQFFQFDSLQSTKPCSIGSSENINDFPHRLQTKTKTQKFDICPVKIEKSGFSARQPHFLCFFNRAIDSCWKNIFYFHTDAM